jgi:hypothetical protein
MIKFQSYLRVHRALSVGVLHGADLRVRPDRSGAVAIDPQEPDASGPPIGIVRRRVPVCRKQYKPCKFAFEMQICTE